MIGVHDLTKTFGEVTAVTGVTFDVKPGEIFAFLGPNGAGKTTTIQMLTTLLHPPAARSPSTASTPRPSPSKSAAGSASYSRTRASTTN